MRILKRVTAFISVIILAAVVPFSASAIAESTLDNVKNAVEGVISYKCGELLCDSDELFDRLSENAGDYSADWYYIALSRCGYNSNKEKSVAALKTAVEEFYNRGLERVPVTDMQRIAFVLSLLGVNITEVNGHNLLADCTYNRAQYRPLDAQGLNSLSFALLLLDSGNYTVPQNAVDSKANIIDRILSLELESGGFALFGKGADIDITSIVLQALAPYKTDERVSPVIERAVKILSERQTDSGSYKSFAAKCSAETTAQAVIALCSLGIDPDGDERFVKNGQSALDGLMTFRLSSGAFSHFDDGNADNMATYQSLCALVAVKRFAEGRESFYDFGIKIPIENNKHSSVEKESAAEKKNNSNKEVKSAEPVTETEPAAPTEAERSTDAQPPKKKAKYKKESKPKNEEITAMTEPVSDDEKPTLAEIKTTEKALTSEKKSNDLIYIDFAAIFAAYIVVYLIKRGKK